MGVIDKAGSKTLQICTPVNSWSDWQYKGGLFKVKQVINRVPQ